MPRLIKWKPDFLVDFKIGGTERVYNADVPGNGTGVVTVTHNLGTADVKVTVRRIAVPGGTTYPLGEVIVPWKPNATNPTTQVDLDFDTYSRTTGEFRVRIDK